MHLGRDMSGIEIREFEKNEWDLYKFLRLESLRDSPQSFDSTLEQEAKYSDLDWAYRLSAKRKFAEVLPLVGFFKNRAKGLAWGVLHNSDSNEAYLYQMWVAPDARNKGLGKALLSQLVLWARELGLRALMLEVANSNNEAIKLYRSFGFVSSDKTDVYSNESISAVQTMSLSLRENDA